MAVVTLEVILQATTCHTLGWKSMAVVTLEIIPALPICDVVIMMSHTRPHILFNRQLCNLGVAWGQGYIACDHI